MTSRIHAALMGGFVEFARNSTIPFRVAIAVEALAFLLILAVIS